MRNTLILAALLAAAPFAASAEGLSYSYVEGGWNRTEINVNDDSDDIDGGYIRGSWKIAEPVYVLAGYQRATKDYNLGGGFEIEGTLEQATVGIGYRQEMTERVEFIADISVLRSKVESDLRLRGRSIDDASDSTNLGFANLGCVASPRRVPKPGSRLATSTATTSTKASSSAPWVARSTSPRPGAWLPKRSSSTTPTSTVSACAQASDRRVADALKAPHAGPFLCVQLSALRVRKSIVRRMRAAAVLML